MKVYFLILNLCVVVILSLNDSKIDKEIQFIIKKDNNNLLRNLKGNLKPVKSENQNINENIIELDPDYFITQISWTKNENYDLNYLFGIFEGSNDSSFKNPIPIAMIKNKDNFSKMNYINISTPNSFKYIRYVPPNKNNSDIFPLKIIGRQLSEDLKLEEQKMFQATNLPLISIYTENLTNITEIGKEVNCNVLIINEGKIHINETSTIRVRGQSTARASDKKPYRLEFKSKQKILNFKGDYKKWTLIANIFDRSILRNSLAFKISELFEFEYTPRCAPVDLLLNGNFRGNYYLCDHIDIGKYRINISKMDKNDKVEPNISGGYFIEVDSRTDSGNHFKTKKGINIKINYPEEEEINSEQEKYIKNKVNKFEAEVYNGVLDSIDLETFSKFFIIEEFSADIDFLYSSFYFIKKRNDDLFYFGPVWDFDLAFDNDPRLVPTNEKPKFAFNYGDSSGTMKKFINELLGNKIVIEYIQKTWEKLCNTVLNENILIDFIEEREQYLKESGELNLLKWDNHVPEIKGQYSKVVWHGRKGGNFEESVEVLKNHVKLRFDTLSNLINNAVLLAKTR